MFRKICSSDFSSSINIKKMAPLIRNKFLEWKFPIFLFTLIYHYLNDCNLCQPNKWDHKTNKFSDNNFRSSPWNHAQLNISPPDFIRNWFHLIGLRFQSHNNFYRFVESISILQNLSEFSGTAEERGLLKWREAAGETLSSSRAKDPKFSENSGQATDDAGAGDVQNPEEMRGHQATIEDTYSLPFIRITASWLRFVPFLPPARKHPRLGATVACGIESKKSEEKVEMREQCDHLNRVDTHNGDT